MKDTSKFTVLHLRYGICSCELTLAVFAVIAWHVLICAVFDYVRGLAVFTRQRAIWV